jgi:hypothetical protein
LILFNQRTETTSYAASTQSLKKKTKIKLCVLFITFKAVASCDSFGLPKVTDEYSL